MSDQQGPSDPIDDETLAFEYTSGLLRGHERSAFETRLVEDATLQALVLEWEEQLTPLADAEPPLTPSTQTWAKIEQRVAPAPARQQENDPPLKWVWALFGAMVAVFVLLVFPVTSPNLPTAVSPSVDYVAVMTNSNNQPSLTTLGSEATQKLTLHWQLDSGAVADEEEDFQLWAVSKRDGEIRSIGVLDDQNSRSIELTPATWRLITDAQSLILTREEAGGSAIDEPSDSILAQGVCARVNRAG